MEAKENLMQEITMAMMRANMEPDSYSQLEMDIQIIMDKYEVSERHTEVVVYNGDRNYRLIQKFIMAKTVAGRTEKTIDYYQHQLNTIISAINKDIEKITPDDIRLYLALRLRRDGISKVTLQNEWRVLSSFFQWLASEGIVGTNPMARVEPIKARAPHEEPFSDIEVEKIRNCLKTDRERAIVEVMLSTGCRVGELAKMRVDELNGDRIVVHGKGEKDRTVYLNAKAIMALETYLGNRKGNDSLIFPLSNGRIEQIMRDIGKRSGVDNVHPHRFRKTCATMALRRGMPLEQVSKMLGHANLDTTKIYISISEDEMEQAHKKYVV